MMTFFAAQTTLFSAYSESDFFGRCIFIALFTLSVICWIILIQKSLQVKKVKKLAGVFQKTCEKNHDQLLNLTVNDSHPFARVYNTLKKKALEILKKNHFFSEEKKLVYLSQNDLELLESHVLTTISTEAKKLEKNLFILSTIRTLAPFLGLLGTVWGSLLTLSELQGGMSAASNSAILGGLSMALATTVVGLVIAIPALIAYNWLNNSSKHLTSDMEDFLYELLSTLELQYRKPS